MTDQVGSRYGNFETTRVIRLTELQCTLKELIHLPTGARVLHIGNDDPENVFCLSFQTLPQSSNGVAHILEHTVLCGSKKYPVKDPFFSMSRRSLNTFMNALTGPDFTCYPAATQLEKDFYNLLEVYLDAVFNPHLKELSFKQEGHRLEFETFDDPNSPLIVKGIVYNEMKGAMNSGPARMHEVLFNALLPDTIYGINSGGDPKIIPTLTYQELLAFHKTFYHPSHCLFYFYGNLPIEKHLDFIGHLVLDQAKCQDPIPPILSQPRFSSPRRIESSYPIARDEEIDNKTMISFGWLSCQLIEQKTCLALYILAIVLLETDASPLKKALLRSGLCQQVFTHVDAEMHEVPIIIDLQGCNAESADQLEQVINETLSQVIREGIPQKAIEDAIHQLEFHRSEITRDYHPFGLTLFMRSGLLLQHGGNPESGLLIHTLFDKVRKQFLDDPHYLTQLVERYLLNNPHFVRVTLIPDPLLEQKELDEEKSRLNAMEAQLGDTQKEHIVDEAKKLKAFQRKQEERSIDVLPKVTLEDISAFSRKLPFSQDKVGNLEVFHHSCFTNEIGYIDLLFDLPSLTKEELLHTRLLTVMLYQIGSSGRGYEKTLEEIHAHTGGIIPYLALNIQASDYTQFFPSFGFRGKALYHKLPELFPLLCNMVVSPDFRDKKRLKEILQKHYINLESSLNQNALKYAVNLAASNLTLPSHIAHLWYGLDYYNFIRLLTHDFEKRVDQLIDKLESLKTKILCTEKTDLVISSDEKQYQTLRKNNFYGLLSLPIHQKKEWNCTLPLSPPKSLGKAISSPVAFIVKAFNTVPFTHKDAPSLNLAAFLLDNLTLHKKIREEGGAYGGGALSNVLSGNFYFYTYRDPHIASSLEAFEEAIDKVAKGDFDDHDIEEAKLEMVQQLDSPISPGGRAITAYSWLREGKTQEARQTFRNRLLLNTKEDIVSAVHTHIVANYTGSATIAFAGRELLEKENKVLKGLGKTPLKIEKI